MPAKEAINDDVRRYAGCLESIRHHLTVIASAISGQTKLDDELQAEIIMLHFRKALEELAFSSLCSNVDRYSEAHKKFATFWRSKLLLEQIGEMNPNFFPQPMRFATGVPVDPLPYLTRDDFKALYDLSSSVMHSWNPYRQEPPPDIRYGLPEWLERFRNLLRIHSIQLLDHEEVWTVIMPDEGDIQIGVARLVERPTLQPAR